MADPFEFQRKLDHATDEMVERAMDQLDESEEKARERAARLIPLDQDHYFDPLEKIVLLKLGRHFSNLGHSPVFLEMAAEKAEEEALRKGYTPIHGGLFWNPQTQHLYVKNGNRYVLYTLDRRTLKPSSQSPK